MRKKVGTVIEYPAVIPHMTARQNLVAQCKLQGVKDLSVIDRILSTVGLESTGKKKAKNFSLGMKQRLAIAQAVMEHPDILMLDEPTNALDRESVERVRQLIESEKKRGVLILLASHNEDDIEILADHVFFLENGSIVDRR